MISENFVIFTGLGLSILILIIVIIIAKWSACLNMI